MSDHIYTHEDPERGTFAVDRRSLVSDEVLELERRHIFDRCWLYVGHESEIPKPGDFVSRTVAGRPLILCRNTDGDVRILYNTCTHRGAEVCRDERGNSKVFQCFYHAWSFDTHGRLVGVPDAAAYANLDREALRLGEPVKQDSYRGFVFVGFDPGLPTLVEYLGDAAPWIDRVADQSPVGMELIGGTHKYTIEANWKLLVENSLDGYHLAPLHKTYFDFVRRTEGDGAGKDRSTRAIDLGNGHALIIDRAPWGRPVARWVPSFGEDMQEVIDRRYRDLEERFGPERAELIADRDCNLVVFPNLVINDVMAVVVRTIWPTRPDQMEVTAWALAPADDDPAIRATTLESYVSFLGPGGFATPDDMEALESCQRGFATVREVGFSDISRGMAKDPSTWTSADEGQTRAFWRRWQQLVTGADDREPATVEQGGR